MASSMKDTNFSAVKLMNNDFGSTLDGILNSLVGASNESTVIFNPKSSEQPQLGLFVPAEEETVDAPEVELPIPAELVDAFAQATGWVIGFEETTDSFRDRVANGSSRPSGGRLKIIDMSPAWPAKTATAHRAKCDRVVDLLNGMLSFDEA